jgi:hypothetical protein
MSILTVISTTIEIGGVTVDAYTANEISSTTGSPINYLSSKGLAESIDLTDTACRESRMSKDLKALLGESFKTINGRFKNISGGHSKINLWKLEDAKKFYAYHALRGNIKAGQLLGMIPMSDNRKISSKTIEKEIQHEMWNFYGGDKEVLTPVGKIDLLTSSELIEIKVMHRWKDALGQILAYSHFYPSHLRRIHLFGETHSRSKNDIEEICGKHNITVTYDKDFKLMLGAKRAAATLNFDIGLT